MKNATELSEYLYKTADDLSSGVITVKVARERTKAANKILKTQLDKLRDARKKGGEAEHPVFQRTGGESATRTEAEGHEVTAPDDIREAGNASA